MPVAGAIIGAVGAIGGGLIASSGAKKAAQTQAQAAADAQAAQERMFQKQIDLQEPFRQGGLTAQQQIMQIPELSEASFSTAAAEADGLLPRRTLELIRAEFENRTWEAFRRTAVAREKPAHVADDLGMSVQAVYKAKSRVLRRLRAELDGLLE